MMRELADNVLDIAQNSIAAGASLVTISIQADTAKDMLTMAFIDDGKGMSPELLQTVTDPFTTTRTTRKVGLGLPLLRQTAEATGGSISIESQLGVGTRVTASFGLSHIDRPPMGDLAGTLLTLVILNDTEFLFAIGCDGEEFTFDTRQIREMMDPLPLSSPDIAKWIRGYLTESIQTLFGGVKVL